MADQHIDIKREERLAFANSLSEFNDQRSWYSKRSGMFKSRAQKLDLVVILSGALIAALPILKAGGEPHWSEIAVSILGAVVVVAQGSMRIFRFGEIWPEYRQASERMKREWRLFINRAGHYSVDEEIARNLYIERLESIIADEQKIFFEQNASVGEQQAVKKNIRATDD